MTKGKETSSIKEGKIEYHVTHPKKSSPPYRYSGAFCPSCGSKKYSPEDYCTVCRCHILLPECGNHHQPTFYTGAMFAGFWWEDKFCASCGLPSPSMLDWEIADNGGIQ